MADEEQLAILKQGVDVWNEWREKNPDVYIDLSGIVIRGSNNDTANLSEINLSEANLSGADFSGANLTKADFSGSDLTRIYLVKSQLNQANFVGANLSQASLSHACFREATFIGSDIVGANLAFADLHHADFSQADLHLADLSFVDLGEANLTQANLTQVNLRHANLSRADLTRANLDRAQLTDAILINTQMIGTQLPKANLSNCRIFGISAWKLNLEQSTQSNLIITDFGEPIITVDNLEIAQFIYLLIHNQKLRDVIDTIGKKAVLILGRFSDEHKAVLEAIREELRKKDYIPILFDFDKPESRDVTETVGLLAHMARFVIADLTDAKSIPQELSHIVPDLPSVAVQPLTLKGQREYGMFEHFQRYPWVLPIHEYEDQAQLIAELSEMVIKPAEDMVIKLRPVK